MPTLNRTEHVFIKLTTVDSINSTNEVLLGKPRTIGSKEWNETAAKNYKRGCDIFSVTMTFEPASQYYIKVYVARRSEDNATLTDAVTFVKANGEYRI